MDREGGNKERMRKCREWISLHFLILSSLPLHFLILSSFPRSPAARLQRFVQPCQRLMFNFHHRQLSPETLSSDLAMARGPLRGIGGTGNCLFRASSSWKIVNIITSIDITMMSLSHKKKHLVAFTSTQLYPLIRPTAYWTKQTPQNKVAPCNFLWRSRTCCRGRREGGRSCPWTPPDRRHFYCHHDGHDKDSYDDES